MPFMKLSVLGLAAVLAATAACAQTNATPTAFQSADTNNDERVSKAEFSQHMGKNTFERLDKDKNGYISLEEWKTMDQSPEAQKHFETLDKDRNGRISYPEFSGAADLNSNLNDSFATLDRDRDGSLAPDEFTARPSFRLLSVNF